MRLLEIFKIPENFIFLIQWFLKYIVKDFKRFGKISMDYEYFNEFYRDLKDFKGFHKIAKYFTEFQRFEPIFKNFKGFLQIL